MRTVSSSLRSLAVLFATGVCLGACGGQTRIEGTVPGDCTDGVDNDRDGLFDCADPSCFGSSLCAPDGGPDAPMDAPQDGPIDAPPDAPTDAPPDVGPDSPFDAPSDGPSDMPADMGPPTCTDPGPGSTYQLVVHRASLSIVATGSAITQGFNLDSIVSVGGGDTCSTRHPDFTSCDPLECSDPVVGIDNQLAALIPLAGSLSPEPLGVNDGNCDMATNEYDLLQTLINKGDLVILLEVSGVSNPANDDCVGFRLTIQAPPSPAPSCEDDPFTMVDERDTIECGDCDMSSGAIQFATGLTFVEDPSFDDIEALGRIVDGEITIDAPSFPLTIPIESGVLSLTLGNVRIAGDFGATSITNGVIGGGISRQEMLDLVGAFVGADAGAVVQGVVDGLLDLEPDESLFCQAMSAGFTFSATSAVF